MQHSELVHQCKANDRKAQLTLYKQYCDGMKCVAMRFIDDGDDAEDVVQEAFIKAFQRISQFKAEVSFGAWLKRIVVNQSLDFIKAKKVTNISIDECYLELSDDSNWEVEAEATVDEVKHSILSLPEKYRFVVQLFLVEGYDHSEISEILSISETASRTRLMRGKALVKASLKKMNYGTGS